MWNLVKTEVGDSEATRLSEFNALPPPPAGATSTLFLLFLQS